MPTPLEGDDEHTLDGCDVDLAEDPTSDEDLPYLVLFAGVPADQVEQHAAALRELGLGGGE